MYLDRHRPRPATAFIVTLWYVLLPSPVTVPHEQESQPDQREIATSRSSSRNAAHRAARRCAETR